MKKVIYLCVVPLAFATGEKRNCRKGEAVNLCLYKARVLLMSLVCDCCVPKIIVEQLIVNVVRALEMRKVIER